MRWISDRQLRTALIVGVVLRVAPLLLWLYDGCVRDECTYIKMADRLAHGQGITSSAGWLWAPAYPFLLSIPKYLFDWAGAIRIPQIAAAAVCTVFVYHLARRAFARSEDTHLVRGTGAAGGPDPSIKTARVAAWLYTLSPHQIFFAGRLWSEVLYGTVLLAALLLLISAREALLDQRRRRLWSHAALVGGAVGVCMLFRGVATYMVPIFVVGMLWRRWGRWRAWGQAALLVAVTATVVAPYSVYASKKFDAFIITDRTLGQMIWLGNNDFDPITFDYGNGQISKRAFERTKNLGRKPCATRKEAIDRDACSTHEGIEWIKAHPREFVRRMPMRVAQMLTPHTLLTRHLRWGKWKGLPQTVDELIILWIVAWSLVVMWVGSVGLAVRGRGAQGLVFGGILLYHVAAIALLAGLSRYRVPLEPLLMVYAAPLLAEPRGSWARVRAAPWRGALAVVVLGAMVPLVLWYLPAGWPQWRSW